MAAICKDSGVIGNSAERLNLAMPARFPGMEPIVDGWLNGIKGWRIRDAGAKPGLYTMDIELTPKKIVDAHNAGQSTLFKMYGKTCVHRCEGCFNQNEETYGSKREDITGHLVENRLLDFDATVRMVDEAIAIARSEGHAFESVKFLGPGELLMNSDLFRFLDEMEKLGIMVSVFTKGAVLGSDALAVKFQGQNGIMSAKELVERLASYKNLNLMFSFQSFEGKLQDELVTMDTKRGRKGMPEYTQARDAALTHIFGSDFANDVLNPRICMINAPINPKNIRESFDIYKFFVERGIPVVMTPTMVSGRGENLVEQQKILSGWYGDITELYAKIYVYNILKGVQTLEQVKREGIASYAGAEPCNQATLGLYLRANGNVEMCPGRCDKDTIFGNVFDEPLSQIWEKSPNRKRGENPQMIMNNKCPAKDGRAFPLDFYDNVMEMVKKELAKLEIK